MSNINLQINAVLEKELYTTPPLMPVVVATILGTKRDIPKAFKSTKDLCTAELRHLRRVRDLPENEGIECIVCKVQDNVLPKQFQEELKRVESELAPQNIFKDYRIAHVPSSAPRTEQQLKACAKIWPCKFAKSNYLIQCLEGSLLDEPEILVLKTIVNNMVNHIRMNDNQTTSGAVVFRCATVYGIGLSDSDKMFQNPINHPTMISIDSVASNSGAGHYKDQSSLKFLQDLQKQLDDQVQLEDHRIYARFLPYLCTNYDIFVTEQPCFMCTMGLVQSRIRRLFYLDSESIKKLENCKPLCYPDNSIEEFFIHREKNLNHRFEAWKITLTL